MSILVKNVKESSYPKERIKNKEGKEGELYEINKFSELKIQKEINKGLSSTLYLAINKLDEKVVIKIFNRKSREAYIKERGFFQKKQKFKNIITVYDYGYIDDSSNKYFGHYYLVMEYAEKGDLVYYIEKQNCNESDAKKIMKQILNGYEEISKCGFIHRDLKPENILIMKDNTLKITDFGFCEKINNISSEIVGTDGYIPPEVLMGKNIIPQKIDIFSLGVILFILVAGQFPFEKAIEKDDFYRHIIDEDWEKYWKLVDENNKFSQKFKELIQGMICYLPKKRLTYEDIKSTLFQNTNTKDNDLIIF